MEVLPKGTSQRRPLVRCCACDKAFRPPRKGRYCPDCRDPKYRMRRMRARTDAEVRSAPCSRCKTIERARHNVDGKPLCKGCARMLRLQTVWDGRLQGVVDDLQPLLQSDDIPQIKYRIRNNADGILDAATRAQLERLATVLLSDSPTARRLQYSTLELEAMCAFKMLEDAPPDAYALVGLDGTELYDKKHARLAPIAVVDEHDWMNEAESLA